MKAEKVFEIAKRVYEAYPFTGKEKRGCPTAKEKNDALRLERTKRIIEEEKEKNEDNANEGEERDNRISDMIKVEWTGFKGKVIINELT